VQVSTALPEQRVVLGVHDVLPSLPSSPEPSGTAPSAVWSAVLESAVASMVESSASPASNATPPSPPFPDSPPAL
jgi:hypothetical protein